MSRLASVVPGMCLALTFAAEAAHLTERDVAAAVAGCEAAREALIAPLREAAVSSCIARGQKDADACERFHRDYGDPVETPSGLRPRLFHDLPECVASDATQKHLRLYPP